MIYRIEIKEKDGFFDALGAGVKRDIEDLGYKGKVKEVKTVRVYLIEGELSGNDAER